VKIELVITHSNGQVTIEEVVASEGVPAQWAAEPGASVQVFIDGVLQSGGGAILTQQGDTLLVVKNGETVLEISDFYREGAYVSLAGSEWQFAQVSPLATAEGGGVVPESSALAVDSAETAVASEAGAAGLGLAGLLSLASLAATVGSDAAASAAADLVINGAAVAGSVIAGNDLLVTAYDNSGSVLGTSSVAADGTFTLTVVGGYTGPVLIILTSTGGATDYNDEATGAATNLSTSLRVLVHSDSSVTLNVSITPLTESAVREAGVTTNAATADAATVTATNAAISSMFGVADITTTLATPIDAPGYATASADSRAYGDALALLSGMDESLGSVGATLNILEAGIDVNALTSTAAFSGAAGDTAIAAMAAGKTSLVTVDNAEAPPTEVLGAGDLADTLVLSIITAYATDSDTNPAPTVANYLAAGVTGVDAANLNATNAAVDGVAATGADTVPEVQALATTANTAADAALAIITAYATDNTNPAPTVANYLAAGVTGVDAAKLNATNAAVDGVAATGADTVPEVQALADNESPAGNATIDLGASGQLIAPIQVEGKWYYFWDRDGDSISTYADQATHNDLDVIFNHDSSGVTNSTVENADGNKGTTDTFRFGTINGVDLALPTYGGSLSGENVITGSHPGTATEENTAANNTAYNGLLAVWDSVNGTSTGTNISGIPPGWLANDYWSATPSASGHGRIFLHLGYVMDSPDTTAVFVALEVL
jgi:hypothetical protein